MPTYTGSPYLSINIMASNNSFSNKLHSCTVGAMYVCSYHIMYPNMCWLIVDTSKILFLKWIYSINFQKYFLPKFFLYTIANGVYTYVCFLIHRVIMLAMIPGVFRK